MSASNINIANVNEKETNNNNNINQFSDNFNKFFNKFKYSKTKSQKENIPSNNSNNASQKNNQKNSLYEFEFLFDDSQKKKSKSKEHTKLNTATKNKNNKNKNTSKSKRKKNYTTANKSYNNDSSSFNSTMKKISTLTNTYKNKYLSRQNKLEKKPKKRVFEMFLKDMNDFQIKKEQKLNTIRNKSLEKEKEEINKRPKMSAYSLFLVKGKKRRPLYEKTPLNEEDNLEQNFLNFYSKNNYNSFINKSTINNKTFDKKSDEFYLNNIKSKKKVEDKNNNKRINKKKLNDTVISSYSFRPTLCKTTMNLMDKLNNNQNKTINAQQKKINEQKLEKELIDRMKIKLKPLIRNHSNNIKRPYITKRSELLTRTLSYNNIRKQTYHNYNYKTAKNPKSNNLKINYKANEKKFKSIKKIGKKDEELNKGKKNINLKKRSKAYYLLKKIKKLEKEKEHKKKELYKLNIRQGTSWNTDAINNIIPRQRCGYIIEGLL